MVVVAAVLGLAAVILLVLLVIARRKAAAASSAAALSHQSIQSDLTTSQRATTRAIDELEAAKKQSSADAEKAKAELVALNLDYDQALKRAATAEQHKHEQSETIGSLERYSVELKANVAAAQERVRMAEATSAAAALELEAARAEADQLRSAVDSGSDPLAGDIDPELLWALEMTRAERTWRHSVAVDPDGPSPFPDAPDPLRFAVEVEAAALREEVGAFIQLDWRAEAVADPIRRLLVLRVANELLAAAAREPQPFEMVSTGSGEIRLLVRATEDGDRQIDLQPPRFGTDVITFASSDEGISVTIR